MIAKELALQLPMTSGQGHFQELSLHVLRIPSRFHDGNGGRVSPRPSGLPAKLPRMPLLLLRLMLSAALSAGLPAYLYPQLQILAAILGSQRSAKSNGSQSNPLHRVEWALSTLQLCKAPQVCTQNMTNACHNDS